MAISILVSPGGDDPATEIQETTRTARAVNATITATADAGEIIESVSASLNVSEPNIVITDGEESVTIIGTYLDPFLDTFRYVSKGSSNLLESPSTAIGVANMPPNKDLYELDQDRRQDTTKYFTITVVSDLGTETFNVTQKILNDLEGIRSFMETYYD